MRSRGDAASQGLRRRRRSGCDAATRRSGQRGQIPRRRRCVVELARASAAPPIGKEPHNPLDVAGHSLCACFILRAGDITMFAKLVLTSALTLSTLSAACGPLAPAQKMPAPAPAAPAPAAPAAADGTAAPAAAPAADPSATARGPQITAAGVRFNFKPAGKANEIFLAGNMNGWNPSNKDYLLKDEDGDGIYSITLPLAAGTYQYKFVIDGTWTKDPFSPMAEGDGFGGQNGKFVVP
jgi:Glycogen recognition site of AMP-activated protein kinase